MRVLVIDDDRMMCQLLTEYLASHGYEVRVSHTGEEGAALAVGGSLDAVILDVMLPGMDGFSVIRRIRAQSAVPILMLTARAQERDRIAGLDAGADDYLAKPFRMEEVLARLRAIIRRASGKAAPVLSVGDVTVDDREIFLFDRPGLPQFSELASGCRILGDKSHAAGLAVEAEDEVRRGEPGENIDVSMLGSMLGIASIQVR